MSCDVRLKLRSFQYIFQCLWRGLALQLQVHSADSPSTCLSLCLGFVSADRVFGAQIKLSELPRDVLFCISDFSGNAVCSHVCAQMWDTLQHWHIRWHVRSERDFSEGLNNWFLHTLCTAFLVINREVSGAQALAVVKDAAALHTPNWYLYGTAMETLLPEHFRS